MFAQRTASILIQRLHILGHLGAGQNAEILNQLESKATGQAGQRVVLAQPQKRLEQGRDLAVDEVLEAAFHLLGHFRPGDIVDKDFDLRLQRVAASGQFAHRGAAPHEAALFGEVNLGVRGVVEPVGAQMELRSQGLQCGGFHRFVFSRTRALVHPKAEPVQLAYKFTFNGDFTGLVYIGHHGFLLSKPAQQYTRAPIYKSLSQTLVQSVRQAVFYDTRRVAPMAFVLCPALALRNVGPCANKRESFGQRINVAIGSINSFDLSCEPIIGDISALVQIVENGLQEPRMFRMADAAEIGNPAHIPQEPHRSAIRGPGKNLIHLRQRLERAQIVGFPRPDQPLVFGRHFQGLDQAVNAAELQSVVAPVDLVLRGKVVIHDRAGNVIVQRRRVPGGAKSAGFEPAPCPPRDLRQFIRGQGPHPPPVKFAERREGHMIDIEVQPHADGIGGNQIVDLSVLIHRHLRIARARRECAHHHRRTALLAADQLGDGIYILNRKPDDCATRLHPAYLFLTCIDQFAHPVAAHEIDPRNQRRDGAAHGVGPHEQRLMQAPRAQQTVGKDMAALGIGAKLDLVDGYEIRAHLLRHRLDSAHPILRARRHDPLFARDQRHHRGPARLDDPVIDLTRQKPQRQADHPGPMGQHPFDCIGRLAGICRAENGHDALVACHLSILELKLAPDAVPAQPFKGRAGVSVMRVEGERLAVKCGRAAQISELLYHHGKAEDRVVIVGVQRQRPLQIIQRGAIEVGPVIGLRPGMESFGESGGVIGQRGQMLDRQTCIAIRHCLPPPRQQQIHRSRTGALPMRLDLMGDSRGLLRWGLAQLLHQLGRGLLGHGHARKQHKATNCRNGMFEVDGYDAHNKTECNRLPPQFQT